MRIHISIAILTAALIASGCVSTDTFDKMQAAKNDEITALQQQKTALERQADELAKQKALQEQKSAELTRQKSELEQKSAELATQKSELEQKSAELARQKSELEQLNKEKAQQIGTLEQQKAALLASSQQRQQQYDNLLRSLSQEVEDGKLKVRQYQNMLAVDLAEKIFFDSGRAVLKPGGKAVLKKVGEVLKGYENKVIRVVGHTDNVPISAALQPTFATNWELSVARATTVVRFLQDVGVSPERMVASGRSMYDPVDTNDTPEGRQNNRRIEILIIDQSLVNAMEKSIK